MSKRQGVCTGSPACAARTLRARRSPRDLKPSNRVGEGNALYPWQGSTPRSHDDQIVAPGQVKSRTVIPAIKRGIGKSALGQRIRQLITEEGA